MKYWSWDLIKSLLPYFAIMLAIVIGYEILVLLKNKAKNKIDKKIASIKTKGGTFIGCSNFPKCRYTQK